MDWDGLIRLRVFDVRGLCARLQTVFSDDLPMNPLSSLSALLAPTIPLYVLLSLVSTNQIRFGFAVSEIRGGFLRRREVNAANEVLKTWIRV